MNCLLSCVMLTSSLLSCRAALAKHFHVHGKKRSYNQECFQPMKRGHCLDKEEKRYWYNEEKHRCESFTYSGCGGNENNFGSRKNCTKTCVKNAVATVENFEIAAPMISKKAKKLKAPRKRSKRCLMAKEAGECEGHIPRFWYNKKLNRCQPFTYGGCGGNRNNFNSLYNCGKRCIPELGPRCFQPRQIGKCSVRQKRYWYNPERNKCQRFIFTGCDSGANNYTTLSRCKKICGIVKKKSKSKRKH